MKKLLIALCIMEFFSLSSPALKAQENYADQYGSVSSFCRDRLQLLKNAYRHAEIESQLGNYSASVALLEGGLHEAAARIESPYLGTLTSKAIIRGVSLLNTLKATEDSRQKLRTINNFLFNYYLFVENVSTHLDIPYFQPQDGYGRLNSSNLQFEKLFINFAKDQVGMVLATMSTTAGEGPRAITYPIGNSTLLLTALKVTTLAMANDLSESIFAARYACTIGQLENASYSIDLYLKNKSLYPDEFVAVQVLVGAVREATVADRNCHLNYEDRRVGRTEDSLRHPIRLENGRTEQVILNGTKYIKKLIISAEGVRNDALFDVVVNGDIKGTIHVPGRDPSYFVTIEDYADSIELVSRNGVSLISRILVVTE